MLYLRSVLTSAVAGALLMTLPQALPAASITLDATTTAITTNGRVTRVPNEISTGRGNVVATGQMWSGGASFGLDIADSFLAWCFDLIHPVGLGQAYNYTLVDEPFSNSYLKAGAESRVTALVNASYDDLDPYDSVQAAAFQLAVWEVSNDDDFNIQGGEFRARGRGSDASDITAQAQAYLFGAETYAGPHSWRVHFLESQEQSQTQNLITATRISNIPDLAPIPLPATAWLFLSALGGMIGLRQWRLRRG